ncbi:class I SAM-dependent methyltransferase [Crocosphaera sp.]|uniref:class I SAM-dependent methyltransferase n=1 Tax=Crocosphaera sp. TaxID=2729996 RepID=UPI003F245F84|nr:class I SAM-dependent methyltransferase [Crocosphaera sp.]
MAAKVKPDWTGNDLLSRFVNLMIQTKPIYRLMTHQARQVIINTAERNGISWQGNCQILEKSPAKSLLAQMTNPDVLYPDYYLVPFHAYDEGNLCWKAAFEAVPATQSLGLRVWKNEDLTWQEAQKRLRASFHQVLEPYSPPQVNNILDIGCSVGVSTKALHRYYSQRQKTPINTIGLDLSPYMLAVAKVTDEQQEISQWVHGLAERTDFADHSFDVITIQFLLHELPRHAATAIFKEALRLLRPGGVLGIVDNNPRSEVIQNLPPALFMLMKSTEPHSDDYYTFNVEEALTILGFEYQTTVPSDHRHRTIVATKPV